MASVSQYGLRVFGSGACAGTRFHTHTHKITAAALFSYYHKEHNLAGRKTHPL